MRQLQQDFNSGNLVLEDVPVPRVKPDGVVIRTRNSLVSAGTEKAMIDLAKKNLVGKARERPDLVKEVVTKARNDGLVSTYQTVKSRLNEPMPLGYSCAGEVVEVGENVTDISQGDMVACGGTGYATHGEYNYVPGNLCTPVPDDVTPRDAAFVTVGAIALQGIRRLDPTPGERIAVIGLGLVGRLTSKILNAYGFPTLGVDIDRLKVTNATELTVGATIGEDDVRTAAEAFSGGAGVDGVIITAATDSNEPIELAGDIAREQGRVSVVGDIGMDVPRDEYYEKELDVRLSRSYGPGRYDRTYEEKGLDYPIGYVRWTENRNMAEFLRLLESDRVTLNDIISHTFAFDDALDAYELILEGGDYTGVVLEYAHEEEGSRTLDLYNVGKRSKTAELGVGLVGAGTFATNILLPTIEKIEGLDLRAVATASGTSAKAAGKEYGAEYVTTEYERLVEDSDVDVLIAATRHDLHAPIAIKALEADKDVHVEKPLALGREELDAVLDAEQESEGRLMVGYNRRFSAPATNAKRAFDGRSSPLVGRYRVNADALPADHWVYDPEEGGGRIIGEVCHFVDFLQFVTDAQPTRVYANAPAINTDKPTHENVQAVLEFEDGSSATVTYATLGGASLAKEHVEILGDGHHEIIDNFKTGRLKLNQDKGFEQEFRALRDAIQNGDSSPIPVQELAYTSLTTFAIRESLAERQPIELH